jgi:TP901 family phage tail tape measure protein
VSQQTIKLGMDVSDVKASTQEFIQALQGQSQAVFTLFEKMAEVNKQGEVSKRVIGGMNEEGQKFEATLKRQGDAWQVLGVKVREAKAAMDEAKKAQEAMEGQKRASFGESMLLGNLSMTGAGSPNLTSGQANTVETAVQRIKSILAEGTVSVERFQELLTKFQQNPKGVMSGLTAEENTVVKALRSIQGALESAQKANKAASDSAETESKKRIAAIEAEKQKTEDFKNWLIRSKGFEDAMKGFDFSKVDPSKIGQVEAALTRLKALLDGNKISLEKFQEILAKLKENPNQVLPDLSKDEQKAAALIRTLVKGFGEEVPKAGEDSERVFISLAGVLRMLEAQILKRIFSMLENEIMGAISAAQQFSLQIAEIQTISQKSQLSTEGWARGITELSNMSGRSQTDVAEGVYQTISNQVAKGTEAFKFMETALGFAQASASSATDSVNLLSGALQSFQLPATEAERVSAILFKTIELGRVRAKDMADTFGRVGTFAQDAGVKLEEVSAAIALLTNRGIRFNDASTLVQNILLKLVKPTEEMKKLFAEWGVSSGTAAIATFGFSGVLQRLDTEAQKGTERLGDLLGQIRAIRGAVGLTGNAFGDYQKYLAEITGGQGEYDQAKKIVAESPGQRAQKELTQLRNFFEQDFGGPFLRGLLVISDAMGGLVNIVKVLVTSIELLAMGYLVWKGIELANLPIMAAEITLTFGWAGANTTLAGSFQAAAVSAMEFLAAVGPYVLVATAAYLVGNRLFNQTMTQYDQAMSKAREAEEKLKSMRQGLRNAENQGDDRRATAARTGQQDVFRGVLQFATAVARQATELKERAVQNYKEVSEATKISAGTYFDSLRNKMKVFTDAVTESKSLIKASLKESEDLQRRGTEKIFNERLKFASSGRQDPISGMIFGEQQTAMVRARITDLANKAREEFGKGTAEGVTEGRRLFNDVERLEAQLFELETARERRVFEFQAQRGQVAPVDYGADGKPRYEFVVRTAEMERRINATTEERLALEKQFRDMQAQRQKFAEQEAERERERIRALQQQFQLLEQIDVFTKEGKIKSDYRGPEGMQKLIAEFDTRRAEIMKLAGTDPQQGFQIFRDLGQQRAALIQQVLQAMRAEETQQVQSGATRDMQNSERLVNEARTRLNANRNELDRMSAGLRGQLSLFENGGLEPNVTGRYIGGGESAASRELREPAEASRLRAIQRVQEAREAEEAFNAAGGRTAANAERLREAVEVASNAIRNYYMELQGGPGLRGKISGDDKTVLERTEMLRALGRSMGSTGAEVGKDTDSLRNAETTSQRMLEQLRNMPEAFQAMQAAAIDAAPTTQATLQSLEVAASGYAEQLERINRALFEQAMILPEARRAPAIDGNFFGGAPKYLSDGGPVGFVPRGSDQVPAMLGRDEFVMTGQATKQFMPLLRAMNAGTMPRYLSQGGAVTNVGDITVNVSGGSTSDQTIRSIGTGLRRGIKRGYINLNG